MITFLLYLMQNKHLIFNSYETFIFFSYSVILFIITQLH